MYLTSIIVIIDNQFDFDDVLISNVRNAGSQVELLIYNNNGNVSDELKDLCSVYIENKTPIEESFSTCVNTLLKLVKSDYACVLYEYGYFDNDWLRELINSHNSVLKSGCLALNLMKSDKLGMYLNENSDDMIPLYYSNDNTVMGMIFFHQSMITTVGGLSESLHGNYALREYCLRVSNYGYNNYYLTSSFSISVGNYQSSYLTTNKNFNNYCKKNKANFYNIYSGDNKKYLEIVAELNNQGIKADFIERLGAVVVVYDLLVYAEIVKILRVVSVHNYKLEVKPIGYFDNNVFKNKLSILITPLR